jgi:peptidoglycan/LPS O-acetylase OafA/YrhL
MTVTATGDLRHAQPPTRTGTRTGERTSRPTSDKRRASLDGLRGVAALLVVGLHSHLPFLAGGYIGVDLFFVLSGYLITGILLGEHALPRPHRWHTRVRRYALFMARRAARLVPGLLIAVAIVTTWAVLSERTSARCTALALTYTMNIAGLGGEQCIGPWHVTWSLAAEEQFYLLWPWALLALAVLRRRRAAWLVASAWVLAMVRLLWAAVTGAQSSGHLQYAPEGRSLSILAGCALALALDDPATRWWFDERRRGLVQAGAGALAALVALLAIGASDWPINNAALTPFAAPLAVLVIAALSVAGEGTWLARLLGSKPLVFVGTVSYGFYLMHVMPMSVARDVTGWDLRGGVIGAAVGLGLATLSFYLLERPIQSAARRRLPAR